MGDWGEDEIRTVPINNPESMVVRSYESIIGQEAEQIKTLPQRIREAKEELKKLNAQKSATDIDSYQEDYNKAYSALQKLLNEEKYLNDALKQQSVYMSDSATKIEAAKAKLRELESGGAGIENDSYKAAYSALQDLLVEEQRQRDIIKQQSIQMNAFSSGIDVAKAKLKELSLTGYGPGDEEYEQASVALQNLLDKEKEYRIEIAKQTESGREREAEKERIAAELKEAEEELLQIKENATISDQKLVDLLGQQKALQEQINLLKKAGVSDGYAEYDAAVSQLTKVNEQIEQQRAGTNILNSALDKLNSSFSKLSTISKKAFSSVSAFLKKTLSNTLSFGKTIAKCTTSFAKLQRTGVQALLGINGQSKKTNNVIKNLEKRILGLAKTVFIFSLIRKGFRAMLSGAQEGFENYLDYDARLKNSVNSLQSSLNMLKANLGAAFAPIVQTALPYLQTLITWLNAAVNAVNQFISALIGRTTYKRAVNGIASVSNGVTDIANNLSDATQGAKKLAKELAHFDELNVIQQNDNAGSSGTSGASPSGSGTDGLGIDYETAFISDKIRKLADEIKSFIKGEDWEGLGTYIASGINKGLQKIYDLINWNNVGPKVTKFTTAFTQTLNSLVDNIDWDLMGRDVGAGVNTIVNALNQLAEGIDFRNIGTKLSVGLRGAIGEIEWRNLGNFLGNKFMIMWNLLDGFVTDMSRKNNAGLTGWAELGQALGNAANGIFEKIDFDVIAETLTNGINGAFEALANFTETFEWDAFTENVQSGIVKFLKDMKWKENGEAFGSFLSHLCTAIRGAITSDTFYELGKGISEFIGALPWGELLETAAELLIDGFGGIFAGMEESGTAGKIAAFIGKAFLAVKIANITGISTLAGLVVGKLAEHFAAEKNTAKLAQKLGEVIGSSAEGASGSLTGLGDAAAGASGGFGGLASSIAPLVGTAGLIVGVGVACEQAFEGLAKFVDKLQGGNGDISEFGGAMDSFIQKLSTRGDILSGTADELFLLKESLEKQNMTAEETKEATQQIIDKLGEYGVTADQATQALNLLYGQQLISDDMMEILTESVKALGNETTNMADNINLASVDSEEAFKGLEEAVNDIRNECGLTADQFIALDTILMDAENQTRPAQEAYESLMQALEDMEVDTETAARIIAETFPNAVKEVKKSVDSNIPQAQETISSSMEDAEKAAADSAKNIQESTEEMTSAVGKNIDSTYGEVKSTSATTWGGSSDDVAKSMLNMKTQTATGMQQVFKNVESYMTSIYNTITNKFQWAGDKAVILLAEMSSNVTGELGNMNSAAQQSVNQIAGQFTSLGTKISSSLGSLYNIGRNAAQSFANGFQSVYIPTPHISISGYNRYQMGNSIISTPNFGVQWFASGGMINALKDSITRFASGGSARGTLFYAGEAGPEIVGHAGSGQSEVLNKSQIAGAIYSAVVSGIRATLGNFTAVLAATVQNGSDDITIGIGEILNQLQGIQDNYYSSIALPTTTYMPDVNRINSYTESINRTNTINTDSEKLLNALAEKSGKNLTIENIMYLDGKIVYQDMVEIDKMEARQTGKSGFAYP